MSGQRRQGELVSVPGGANIIIYDVFQIIILVLPILIIIIIIIAIMIVIMIKFSGLECRGEECIVDQTALPGCCSQPGACKGFENIFENKQNAQKYLKQERIKQTKDCIAWLLLITRNRFSTQTKKKNIFDN